MSEVRFIENHDLTSKRKNNQNVRDTEICLTSAFFSFLVVFFFLWCDVTLCTLHWFCPLSWFCLHYVDFVDTLLILSTLCWFCPLCTLCWFCLHSVDFVYSVHSVNFVNSVDYVNSFYFVYSVDSWSIFRFAIFAPYLVRLTKFLHDGRNNLRTVN